MTDTATRKIIPLAVADASLESCAGAEPFALMVLGDSMLPEFSEGDIVIIEPEGLARDGAFVLAWHNGEYIFRQLIRDGERWLLHPLNVRYPDAHIADLAAVKGVIIQKRKPGSRRSRKSYVD